MFFNKRALTHGLTPRLTLSLGLFFSFLITLNAQETDPLITAVTEVTGEISFNAGTLWVEEKDGSGFGRTSMLFNIGKHVHLGFDMAYVFSDLPVIDGSITGVIGKAGYNTTLFGVNLTAGILEQSKLRYTGANFFLTNQGGDGSFFALDTPLHLGKFTVTPSVLYGSGTWEDGDLYAFFGKPSVPSLWLLGLSLDYKGLITHTLGFYSLNTDLNIIDNNEEPLFTSNPDAGLLYYKAILKNKTAHYSGLFGWFYATADLNGELNTSNQPYFLFPYLFYRQSANIKAQALFAGFSTMQNIGIFRFNIDLGALHFFHDRGSIDTHYRRKNLFGGDEHIASNPVNIKGSGLGFLVIDASIPELPITDKLLFTIGLQKIFALPWSNNNLFEPNNLNSGVAPSLVKSILLSGLSIYGVLRY